MMIKHIKDLKPILLSGQAVKHASMKVLVGPEDGFDTHVFRVLTLEKNGYSPFHKHPWFHVNYVLEGKGEIEIDGVVTKVEKGHYAFIESNQMHQFRNTGDVPFVFVCIVIKEGHIV
ncbi:MAG: cupin domain-containing protein [Acholeplasma sp.]|nr:cupin domain-containing protein [Acholeplasma sp.]